VDTHPAPDLPRIISEVADHLLSHGRQLVTAESCTGGWIAKACTDRPGSSRWFRGGAVVYTDELKTAMLGVQPRTLAEAGAVSEATVREMAAGALGHLGGDVAVAVSGIAGPDGGTPAKPVGTVWIAWAVSGLQDRQDSAGRAGTGSPTVRTARHQFEGDRDAVRRQAVGVALQGVLET
jgi:nicotinamide-nucleotide amidase